MKMNMESNNATMFQDFAFKLVKYVTEKRVNFLIISYLILVLLFSNMKTFSNSIIAVLSLPILIIMPLLVGGILLDYMKDSFGEFSNIVSLAVISWIIGTLILFLSVSLLYIMGLFNAWWFTNGVTLSLLILLLYKRPMLFSLLTKKQNIKEVFGNLSLIPLIFLAGSIPLFYIIPKLPHPMPFAASYLYVYQALQFTDMNIIDVVRGNVPVIAALVGFVSKLCNLHPLYVYSSIYLLNHLIYAFSAFLLSYRLTKRMDIAVFSSIVSHWTIGNLMTMTFSNRFLLYVIFPLLLYVALDCYSSLKFGGYLMVWILVSIIPSIIVFLGPIVPSFIRIFFVIFLPIFIITLLLMRKHHGSLIYLVLTGLFVSIIHPYEGLMVVFFLLSFIFSLILTSKKSSLTLIFRRKNGKALKLSSSFLIRMSALMIFIVSLALISGFITFPEEHILSRWRFPEGAPPEFNLDASEKFIRLKEQGPEFALYLFLISIPLITAKEKSHRILSLIFMSSVIMLVTFLPEGWLYRASSYLGLCFALTTAYLLFLPSSFIEKLKIPHRKLRWSKLIPLVYFTIIFILVFPSFQSWKLNYFDHISKVNPEGTLSSLQTYDLEAVFYLYENVTNSGTINDILLVSDPNTMYIMRSLVGVDTCLREYKYIFEYEYSKETLEQMEILRKEVFMASSPENAYRKLVEIISGLGDYERTYIIITPRTSSWVTTGKMFGHYGYPLTKEINDNLLSIFGDERFFTLIYSKEGKLYLYEVKHSR